MNKSSSPSRTYVAVCNKMNFDGYYFKKFCLPEHYERERYVLGLGIQINEEPLENSSDTASWYFLNQLDMVACIDGVITWEDYSNITTCEDKQEEYYKAVEATSHEPGCDGNFNGGQSCSCSPYNEEN